VYAGIGASRRDGRRLEASQSLQDRFDFRLDGAPLRLALPSHEPGPVVVHYREEGPARHMGKIGTGRGPIKPRNLLSYLTKGDFAG